MRTKGKDEYLKLGQIFEWAYASHYTLWFKGERKRDRRTEQIMPRLVRYGRLVSVRVGHKLAYAVLRKKNTPVLHGLGCTEIIIRFQKSLNGELILPKEFTGLGVYPDVTLRYGNTLLSVEFSTQANFETDSLMKRKVTQYTYAIGRIKERFKAEKLVILFVLDISRERVKSFVERTELADEFRFTDYSTFKSVEMGKQLTSPIYLWRDGETYPLKYD